MVTLKRYGMRVYYDVDGDTSAKRIIHKSLSIFHPQAYNIPSYQKGYWDGYVKFYKSNRTFPIGLIGRVKKALKDEEIKYVLDGFEDMIDVSNLPFSEPFLLPERDYQRESIKAFLKVGHGIIKVPTRGGKTYVAGEIIRLVRLFAPETKVLFITDSSDALKQSAADLAGIANEKVGTIQGSKVNIEDVTVGMIQTMTQAIGKKDERGKILRSYVKTVGLLIIDEVHEHYSDTRRKFFDKFENRKMILGISATPYKISDPIGSLNLQSITGDIVYDIQEIELKKRKVLAQDKIGLIVNEFEYNTEGLSYQEIERLVILECERRNGLIKMLINLCEELNLKTLVMFSKIEQGEYMEALTGHFFLHGNHDGEVRDYVKHWFLSEGTVLLVSHIWKKAITLPEVEVFINASGGMEKSLIIQKRGRVLGATKDKQKAMTWDILDAVDYLDEHSVSRLEAYEGQMGSEKDIDVFNSGDDNLEDMLREYMKNWFYGKDNE